MAALQHQILQLIEEEVERRTSLKTRAVLDIVARLYDIPIERLIKDTLSVDCNFCRGILKSKQRCLKKPKDNGYCGFHQCQSPQGKQQAQVQVQETEEKAPWD
jgi:hypothetical protein